MTKLLAALIVSTFAVGAFADPDFPPPQASVYDCRRHAWVQLPPGTKAYDTDPP